MTKGSRATRNSDGTVSIPNTRTARSGGSASGVKAGGTKVGTGSKGTRIHEDSPKQPLRLTDKH